MGCSVFLPPKFEMVFDVLKTWKTGTNINWDIVPNIHAFKNKNLDNVQNNNNGKQLYIKYNNKNVFTVEHIIGQEENKIRLRQYRLLSEV